MKSVTPVKTAGKTIITPYIVKQGINPDCSDIIILVSHVVPKEVFIRF